MSRLFHTTDARGGLTIDPLQLTSGPLFASALGVAARLGIADLLHVRPMTFEELGEATGTRAPILLRVLRALASVNIFSQRPDGTFENTDDSDSLRTDHPRSVRHYCMLAGAEYYRAFGEIMRTVTTGEPAFACAFGSPLYEYMEAHPQTGAVYDRAMEDLTRPVGEHLARSIDFTHVLTVVDIGGGNGALLKPLLRAYPHLVGICLEQERVCARARCAAAEAIDTAPERLQFVVGDLFREIPIDADFYVLKNVLHNWSDDSALRALNVVGAAVTKAAATGMRSRLLIIEPLSDQGAATTMPGAIGDLFQLAICEQGAYRRGEADFRRLLHLSGFSVTAVVPLPTGHTVLDCVLSTNV